MADAKRMGQKPVAAPLSNNGETAITPLQADDVLFGKYRVLRLFARGGMNSYLYIAQNLSVNPDLSAETPMAEVVIKVVMRLPKMKEDNWTKFKEELVTASRVVHPNLVQTYDVAQPSIVIMRDNKPITLNDVIVIVMEYVRGPSLHKLLRSKGYFSIDEVMFYFRQMVLGVRRLHTYSHAIIHRDLKPENIALTPDLRVIKIIDFGISSSIVKNKLDVMETLTNETALFGTVEYMTPDNFLKYKDASGKERRIAPTPHFDLFSLGIILYEMMVGQKPYKHEEGDNKQREAIMKAQKFDIPPMRGLRHDVSNSIENIVFRCVASKNEDLHFRYQTCDELLADVDTYNDPDKRDAPLLKPIARRVLENAPEINTNLDRMREGFWYAKKTFITFTTIMVALLILVIAVVCYVALKK